ncbi:hypothetical protein HMI54_013060 [Coelomomyces lativittatus]|nr:hypothetical protein HMI56_006477 [Coelomomyces lativittatus]KAJ1514897.1 hypothetical protein HMI55_004236 [Coelomomyces lativittatus]KAJ1514981.1 hypothetical protein HMI54_013060 [Coelomomyces lativittatus]
MTVNTAFSMWAHYQGIGAGLALVAGGIIAYFYPVRWWSIYGASVGILLLLVEHFFPGGFPKQGASFLTTQYFLRGFVFLALSPACYMSLPLHDGGIFVGLSGLTYMVAHVMGETKRDRDTSLKQKSRGGVEK